MRGLSWVEVEVSRSDWFIRVLSSSPSTFFIVRGSETITFHMSVATLWGPRALSARGRTG